MAPDTPVWQPAILTRPERNMTISQLWVNYQCAELYPGRRTSPQCNVPATPLVFEPGLIVHSRVASQRSNQLSQRVRPAGEKLAGRLDCHTIKATLPDKTIGHIWGHCPWNTSTVTGRDSNSGPNHGNHPLSLYCWSGRWKYLSSLGPQKCCVTSCDYMDSER